MPKAYSTDLRERVLRDIDTGMSNEDTARKYNVAIATVYNWKKQRRETGSCVPKKYTRGPKRKLAPYEQEIRQLVADHADATLEELHAMLPNKDNVTIPTLHNFLKHLKISWKKNVKSRRATSPRRCGRAGRMEETAGDH